MLCSSDAKKYPEGFTGEADATYANGDKYGGDWKDGVSTPPKLKLGVVTVNVVF